MCVWLFGSAGSSVVERSIAARRVTGSNPVSRSFFVRSRVQLAGLCVCVSVYRFVGVSVHLCIGASVRRSGSLRCSLQYDNGIVNCMHACVCCVLCVVCWYMLMWFWLRGCVVCVCGCGVMLVECSVCGLCRVWVSLCVCVVVWKRG